MRELSDELVQFINDNDWTFAKTYAQTWPHEYIVQEKVDEPKFLALAEYIDTYGQEEPFYHMIMTYFYYGDYVYWHMENIINRCRPEETYIRRLKEGRLPKNHF